MKGKFATPLFLVAAVVSLLFFQVEIASSQWGSGGGGWTFRASDPGVRGGPAGAGGPIAGLSYNETKFFNLGKDDFEEAEDVPDGVGPRMNLDGCGECHSQPATGGTSPFCGAGFKSWVTNSLRR